MTTRPAGTRRPLAMVRVFRDGSHWRTVRRGALWLVSALMLCEWRYAPPTLFSEQRSARSATTMRHCRRNAPCTTSKAVSAWSDSLTYLSSGVDGPTTLKRWPEDGLPITVWIAESGGPRTRAAPPRPACPSPAEVYSWAGLATGGRAISSRVEDTTRTRLSTCGARTDGSPAIGCGLAARRLPTDPNGACG